MQIYFDPAYNDTSVGGNTLTKADHVARSLRDRPIDGVTLVSPRPVGVADLHLVHDPEYVQAVQHGEPYDLAASNTLGWDERLFAAVSASTGGVVQATLKALAERTVSGSLSSGLHHARRDRGAGYCTVNGLALAAVVARAQGARRVLILDLDAHCGGGTADIIDGHAGVEQIDISVSTFDAYDSTANSQLQIVGARDYLHTVEVSLDRVVDPAGIDLLLYNAGMDPHARAGGVAGIDRELLAERESMVFEWAAAHRLPVAWVLAGGYTHGIDIDELVDLHRLTVESAITSLRSAHHA